MVRFAWRAYPSGVTTEVNAGGRALVDPPESIGHPGVAKATGANNSTNSMFALLKGIASGLSVPDGTGAATVNSRPPHYGDGLHTLGERSDAKATNTTGAWSLMALLKGIADQVGV